MTSSRRMTDLEYESKGKSGEEQEVIRDQEKTRRREIKWKVDLRRWKKMKHEYMEKRCKGGQKQMRYYGQE